MRLLILAFLLLLPLRFVEAQEARSYTTVSAVTVSALSNGVQIRVRADGILQSRRADLQGRTMTINFPDARNGTGKNFFNINSYPVSFIQLSSQGAQGGIGMDMSISCFVDTRASLTPAADGQSVLITVQSNRTVQTNRPGAGTAGTGSGGGAKPDVSTEVVFKNGKLTLRAVRADIHELTSAIARQTGISLAVDDAVDRKVSLSLKDVTPEEALSAIATGYGLGMTQNNGMFTLSEGEPRDLATYQTANTASFRMQNTQARTASELLPNFLFSYVKVNPEQNAVVVTAPSQMLQKIGEDLNRVDTPSPQISIEAIAVELTDTRDLDLGLRLGNTPSGSFASIVPGTGSIFYNTIGTLPRNFDVSLTALELSGKARVRARPRMAVINGRTADIFIGAQRFILTQFNQFGQTQTRIQPVDVGVKLRVTPLTGGNNEITTTIAPEVSNITELDLQTGLPVLSTRRTETTVRVRDGETIAIGGLTLDQEQTRNGKIPILGDIPLLGGLFRSKKRNVVKTELVVFITPRILRPEDATAAPPAAGNAVPDAAAPVNPAPSP